MINFKNPPAVVFNDRERPLRCYHQMNNIKEAIKWAEKALKQDDADQKLIKLLAIMKNKGS